jgi:hypothetical protein
LNDSPDPTSGASPAAAAVAERRDSAAEASHAGGTVGVFGLEFSD